MSVMSYNNGALVFVYSIIVPSKSMPSLLQRYLNSIPESDHVKVIVVDDNSDPDVVISAISPVRSRKVLRFFLTREDVVLGV